MNDNPTSLPADPKIYRQRLLDVARALREAPDPKAFSMLSFTYTRQFGNDYPCGTPMCALGHYGARSDLQDAFFIDDIGHLRMVGHDPTESVLLFAEEYFGISREEVDELFENNGCGNARTPEEAIAYIERFVAQAWPEFA